MQIWGALRSALRHLGSFKSVHVAAPWDLIRDTHRFFTDECNSYSLVLSHLATQPLEELVLPLNLDPLVLLQQVAAEHYNAPPALSLYALCFSFNALVHAAVLYRATFCREEYSRWFCRDYHLEICCTLGVVSPI